MEQIKELKDDFSDLKPWGQNIDRLYHELEQAIIAGEIDGIDIEMFRQIEKDIMGETN